MTTQNKTLPWSQPDWLDQIQQWITPRLAEHGLRQSGPLDLFHSRPWSAVVRVPSETGPLFFKSSSAALGWEAALTSFLAQYRPGLVPDLVGVDITRGWLLMRDCGEQLRTAIRTDQTLTRWQGILPAYVRLQKDSVSMASSLLELGIPDRRLETLPGLFASLLEDVSSLQIGQPEGLAEHEYRQLIDSQTGFAQRCAELNALGIPACLHHDDFHDGNVFIHKGKAVFTDWGESALTHPFFSLVVMLRGACNSLDLTEDAPQLDEMREWYLREWDDYGSKDELLRAVALAEQVGLVNRALTWRRVLAEMPTDLRQDYASAVPSYLQDYLAGL